jgi:TRAP-type C4-dicarboxylate transport system permease small subunit
VQQTVRKVIEMITRIEKGIVFVAFLAMVAALSADVIGREIFGHGVFGAIKFAVYALIYCAMAGFGIATASGSHLRPKFLDNAVPRSLTGPATRAGQFASAGILLTLAWAGWTFVSFSMLIEERDVTLDWLIWPIEIAIPIGFALSAIRHIAFGIWPDLLPEERGVAE